MRITLSINSEHSIELTYDQATSVVYELDDKPALADFFAKAANHPASQMRCIVARKSCLPISVLKKLAHDSHGDVVREVAQNKTALKAFSADLLIHMMNRDFGVAFELADNLSLIEDIATRDSVINFMQERGDPEMLGKIAKYYRSLTKQA
ncbi:MAG: hypothetical protein CTY12_08045 [Methylotenera sp.]|nr:MAG: hypothetical protein CTY12_08045 [Methylotenera sp.]